MSILINTKEKTFTINTKNSSYQMIVSKYNHLLHSYYGKRIGEDNLYYLLEGLNRGCSGNPYEAQDEREYSLDCLPQEFSGFGTGDYRHSAIKITNENGSSALLLEYKDFEKFDSLLTLKNMPHGKGEGETLVITLEDKYSGIQVKLYYGVISDKDIIIRWNKIINSDKEEIYVNKILSSSLDFQKDGFEIISFYGKHAMERQYQRTSLFHGNFTISSSRGASSHHQNPFVILVNRETNETSGDAYGMSFIYSGDFIVNAEVDQINQTRVSMGINPENFRWLLSKGESFTTPQVVLTYSHRGLGELSNKLHDFINENIIVQKWNNVRRPVLINNWEATEFDFNEETIVDLAKSAKELGVELFVLDDGWFGRRNSDTEGLGDWFVNKNKLPSGIDGLSKKINDLGMEFGLWIEPEMINERSKLFEEHEDWVIKIPNRNPNIERRQMVLNMGNDEVIEYLKERLTDIIDNADISYIKWDMNRNLSDLFSTILDVKQQGETAHRHILGVYKLMDYLTKRYPNILWEGCAGGGGRFDLGILFYMPQIWCSDDTDAIERLKIQYGTSFGYPVSTMGAHVSVSPNLQTGRITPMETRGIVAMSGTFGYELDVRKLPIEEREIIKEQIIQFKKDYDVIHFGDYYRLTNAKEDCRYTAWGFVSKDKIEAIFNVVLLNANANPSKIIIRPRGLEENKKYRVEELNIVLSGSTLMEAGLPIRYELSEYEAQTFHLKEV